MVREIFINKNQNLMGKLFISFLMVTFFSITSLSQKFIQSFANESGRWSDYSEHWIWNDIIDTEITFLLQGNVIIANDEAKSTYTTTDIIYDDGSTSTWSAIDEKGRNCFISMCIVNGYNCLLIIYDDYCFRYYY